MPADGAVNLYRWPWTGVYQFALVLSMLTALLCLVNSRDGKMIRFNGFSPAVLLLMVAFGSSCFLTEFSDRVALNLIVPVSALCLGYTTHCLVRNSERPEKLAFNLFQGMGVVAFLLYFRSLSLWVATTFWGPESEIISSINALAGYSFKSVSLLNEPNNHPFGHPNYTAGYSLLTLPLVVSLSLVIDGPRRWFWRVVSILGLVALLSSGSRAGTGGAAVALLGGAIFYLKGKAKTRCRFKLGMAGAIILVVILVFSQPRLRTTIGHFVSGKGFEVGDHTRLNLLATGLKMGMEHPFLGNGPGTTSIYYPAFWDGSGNLSNAYQLHCAPLQIWVDLGALGLLAAAGLLFAFFHSWRRLSFNHAEGEWQRNKNRLLVLHGTGLGVGAYLLFSLTDSQLDIYFISGMLAIYGGLFSALRLNELTEKENLGSIKIRKTVRIGTGLALIVLCAAFGWKQYSLFQARSGVRAALVAFQNNDGQAFLTSIDETEKWSSSEPYFYNYLGWLAAEARHRGQFLLLEKIFFDRAYGFWESSLALYEVQEFCHYNLGWLNLDSDPERSAYHFRRAAEINPGKRGVYFGLALALKKTGLADAALNALALECLSQPQFATLILWKAPNFSAVLPGVKTRLWEYYSTVDRQGNLSAKNRQSLSEAEALTQWWWGESFDFGAFASGPYAQTRFFGSLLEGEETEDKNYWKKRAFSAPILLAYKAWKEPEKGSRWLEAAKLRAMGEPLSEAEGNSLLNYLRQPEKSFPQLLLESQDDFLLPLNIYRNQRLAFGLMNQNLDGPIPGDFFLYEQNLLLKIAQVWLYPARGYLPGSQMRRFLEELPNN